MTNENTKAELLKLCTRAEKAETEMLEQMKQMEIALKYYKDQEKRSLNEARSLVREMEALEKELLVALGK